MNATTQTPAAPYTLRFTEWRCGHHCQRPADIPVHSIEHAQLILQAIGNAISQPGHARAAIFDGMRGTVAYLTDDYAETIREDRDWPLRTTVYHGSQEEVDQVRALGAAFDYAYGGEPKVWDGETFLDDMEVITTLDADAIDAAIAPVDWDEEDFRKPVCDVPPVIKPIGELLEELRECAVELAQEGGAA
jgi:hypothetical protein